MKARQHVLDINVSLTPTGVLYWATILSPFPLPKSNLFSTLQPDSKYEFVLKIQILVCRAHVALGIKPQIPKHSFKAFFSSYPDSLPQQSLFHRYSFCVEPAPSLPHWKDHLPEGSPSCLCHSRRAQVEFWVHMCDDGANVLSLLTLSSVVIDSTPDSLTAVSLAPGPCLAMNEWMDG